MTDPRYTALGRRKVRGRSMVLLLVGTALLMPPLIGVSLLDAKIAGIPAPLVYVFGVWALLIGIAFSLAGPLAESDPGAASPEADDAGG